MAKNEVIIVGAGPAGLFAAETLSSNGHKVIIFDKGRDIEQRVCPKEKKPQSKCQCRPCSIYAGLGGAGGKSDGKLNFHPLIGGDLFQYTAEPEKYIQKVDDLFTDLSGIDEYATQNGSLDDIVRQALAHDLEFVKIKLKHVGSDRLVGVMKKFRERLVQKGVEFRFQSEVRLIQRGDRNSFRINYLNYNAGIAEAALSKYLLLAPGREGSAWLAETAQQLGIPLSYLPIDIGVRVETLNKITQPMTDLQYDPKIRMLYHDALVRNFCTNPQGFVVTENYGNYCLVNGHAENQRKSDNCNFAVLYRVRLTEPETNTTAYGTNLAKMFNDLGCQKPIVQRLEDLKSGRRSTEKRIALSRANPTLKEAVPGDITLAMPEKIMKGIVEFLGRLDTLMPGIFQGNNTLLYAPEIKFQSMRGKVDQNFETSVKGIYLAGDGCGLSGGIVPAAVTGILAAEGMIRKIR